MEFLVSRYRFGGVNTDLSGAYIFATEPGADADGQPVDFAAVWGQEPYGSSSYQSVQLDMVSAPNSQPLPRHIVFLIPKFLINGIFVITPTNHRAPGKKE